MMFFLFLFFGKIKILLYSPRDDREGPADSLRAVFL
jgi:hypothetical protein